MQGYLVNYDQEREIWARVLKHVLKVCLLIFTGSTQPSWVVHRVLLLLPYQVNPRDCSLCITEPILNFPQVQAATEQV